MAESVPPDSKHPAAKLPQTMGSVPPGLKTGMIIAGKYELRRKLGRGAMGEVWAARHATMGAEVALKLVVREVDNGDGTSSESRFLLEARVAAALSRKTRHIVAVTDHGQDGELGYLVMELLEGEGLDARLDRTGPMPLADVVPLVTQIARGLAVAHADGVTHRDLKPSNAFVTTDDKGRPLVKVLDFGIAKLRRKDPRSAISTQRGFLLGTPAYMSPEQARGKPVDHRADVWALAVIAYHLLTNEFPFDAGSADALFERIIQVSPISVHQHRPDLPEVVADFFARAFAKRLEDRFQSALSLASVLEQLEPLAAGGVRSLPAPALATVEVDFEQAALAPRRPTRVAPSELEGGSSIIAAGVPRRHRLGRPVLAGLLVGSVMALTAALLGVYYEREAPPRAPATLATSPLETPAVTAGGRVPPPEPAVAIAPITVTEPATASAPIVMPRSLRPVATPTPAPAPRSPPSVDKAEIF